MDSIRHKRHSVTRDEKPDPTSEDECGGCVTDSDSENVTRSDQRQQAYCDAVTDVTDNVPEGLFADDWMRMAKLLPGVIPAAAVRVRRRTGHPESIRRGNCTRCFLTAKQGRPVTAVRFQRRTDVYAVTFAYDPEHRRASETSVPSYVRSWNRTRASGSSSKPSTPPVRRHTAPARSHHHRTRRPTPSAAATDSAGWARAVFQRVGPTGHHWPTGCCPGSAIPITAGITNSGRAQPGVRRTI